VAECEECLIDTGKRPIECLLDKLRADIERHKYKTALYTMSYLIGMHFEPEDKGRLNEIIGMVD